MRVVLNTMRLQVSSETCLESHASDSGIDAMDGLLVEWTQERFEERKLKSFPTRLGEKLICGQYDSYRSEEGVDPLSGTPTFVAGDIYIDNWRWKGVPFYFMTGKKMPYQCVEVVIKLKGTTCWIV